MVERVSARGETRLERLVSLVLLGDLVSLYLAVLRGVDPVHVRAIDALKERLAAAPEPEPGSKVAVMSDTATSTRTAASIIDGRSAPTRPAGGWSRPTPRTAPTSSPRCCSTDADGFVDACRAARAAQAAWAAVPAPVRGRVIAQVGRLVEANKEALVAADHARDRQALPGGARRGPGDHRHVRLLPRRGPPAVRPDGPVGDARQAAVHVPHAGRRRGDRHRRQLPRRGAVVVPRAGDPVRQRGRLEAGRVQRGDRQRAGAAPARGRRARRAC